MKYTYTHIHIPMYSWVLFFCVCMCVFSVMSNSLQPHGLAKAPLSMGFCRQEYWSKFPCLTPGFSLKYSHLYSRT